ncbi:hypothetical protein BXZ70DRAFT_1060855 [Cristinia sonorae]|uniref:Peptidase A1 domain-containing protein n=1 Tax=Cristinia sonorae TaxID=1940300 RepID=A0A8K0XU80_9AGAR|nr:hypothetical protein BXZ70DRAFT_1060855 [Cristinia sonorae]
MNTKSAWVSRNDNIHPLWPGLLDGFSRGTRAYRVRGSPVLVPALLLVLVAICTFYVRFAAADASTFVPTRRNIPLYFDDGGRYYASVIMGRQRLNLTISTSTGMTYVAGEHCGGCKGAFYNQGESPSAMLFANTSSINVLGGYVDAVLIKENCSLSLDDGSLWVYANQTVAVLQAPPSRLLSDASGANIGQDSISGLIGLGTNRNLVTTGNASTYNPSFDDSIYGQFLALHPNADNFTFGISLQSPVSTDTTKTSHSAAGIIHWLQPDPSSYDSASLTWAQVNNSLPLRAATDPKDWAVNLDGWVFVNGRKVVSNRAALTATVDLVYQGIFLPLSEASLIRESRDFPSHCDSDNLLNSDVDDAIPGSQIRPSVSTTMGSLTQSWSVPCDADFTLDVIVGSQAYKMDRRVLVIDHGDGTCSSGIEAWADAGVDQYLLGARFMSTVYMIFSVNRDGSSAVGFARKAKAKPAGRIDIRAVIGGTLGAAAFSFALIAALWFCVSRHRTARHRKRVRQTLLPNTPTIVKYPIDGTSSLNLPVPSVYDISSPVRTQSPISSFKSFPASAQAPDVTRSGRSTPVSISPQSIMSEDPDGPAFFRILSRNHLRGFSATTTNHPPSTLSSPSPYLTPDALPPGDPQVLSVGLGPTESAGHTAMGRWSSSASLSMTMKLPSKERESCGPPAYSPGILGRLRVVNRESGGGIVSEKSFDC